MDEGRAQVQVVVTAFVDEPGRHRVDEESQETDTDENIRLHFGRRDEALIGFVKNKDRDNHQRGGVDQRGQNPRALIAVGLTRRGRLGCQPHGEPTQAEGEHIGKIVTRVREKREAVRPPSRDGFDDDEDGSDGKRKREAAGGLIGLGNVEVCGHKGSYQ